jgi:hypothetical protein
MHLFKTRIPNQRSNPRLQIFIPLISIGLMSCTISQPTLKDDKEAVLRDEIIRIAKDKASAMGRAQTYVCQGAYRVPPSYVANAAIVTDEKRNESVNVYIQGDGTILDIVGNYDGELAKIKTMQHKTVSSCEEVSHYLADMLTTCVPHLKITIRSCYAQPYGWLVNFTNPSFPGYGDFFGILIGDDKSVIGIMEGR